MLSFEIYLKGDTPDKLALHMGRVQCDSFVTACIQSVNIAASMGDDDFNVGCVLQLRTPENTVVFFTEIYAQKDAHMRLYSQPLIMSLK